MLTVTRAHVIAWRKVMEDPKRKLEPAHSTAQAFGLSSQFDYLCECNAVSGNPVDGFERADGLIINECSTPALGDAQAREMFLDLFR